MITVLHRGGYAQMITILHRGRGGSLGTPKSDYVICARPLTYRHFSHHEDLPCKSCLPTTYSLYKIAEIVKKKIQLNICRDEHKVKNGFFINPSPINVNACH